jgi:hypothetical protein
MTTTLHDDHLTAAADLTLRRAVRVPLRLSADGCS